MDRIPDVRHPEGMMAERNSESEWNGGEEEFRVWMEWRRKGIPGPNGMAAERNSGCETSGEGRTLL